MGLKPIKKILQKDSMDDELRNRLWNCFSSNYIYMSASGVISDSNTINFLDILYDEHFKIPSDKFLILGRYTTGTWNNVREYFFRFKWFEVYDFIEFTINNHQSDMINDNFIKCCNKILETEVSAYRLVGKGIIPITSDEEISEIEASLQIPLQPVREHMKRSLELLSDRENPDYRNSIKESISAVESMCKIITGDGNIRNALSKIRKDWDLHDNLKAAFQNLYSYTSDSSGIRHCMTADPDVGQEEAKFMLVTCSAFVNYLVAKASTKGIDLSPSSPK